MDTVPQVWTHQCRAEGKDHFLQPAGNTPDNRAQDTPGLLCSKGTIAGSFSTWCPPEAPGHLLQSRFPDGWFPAYIVFFFVCFVLFCFPWGYDSPGAGLCISLHEIPARPFLQPVKDPLNGNRTNWYYQPLLIVLYCLQT